jgi:SAM-dependent methyltransferase
MWGSPGRAYNEISRVISGAIEHCVDRLAPQPGERILDVATGTGWTSRRVAARGAKVCAIDIAEDLLAAARVIAEEEGLDIDYRLGDAERLPYDDASFDGIVSTFGVMFAPDQEAAIGELARVCRPGGRIAVAAWQPDSTPFRQRQIMAPFMPPTPEGAATLPSPFNWGDPQWLRTALGSHFDLACEGDIVSIRHPDADTCWRMFAESFGPVKALADALDSDRRDELRKVFIDFTREFQTEIGIAWPCEYLVTVGTRK